MDFQFTEEQDLLRESLARLLADRYDVEKRLAIIGSEAGWSRQVWQAFAELGILAMPFAEEEGGLGGGPVETMLAMEELGRALVVEPFLPTVVLAGGLLRQAGNAEQKAANIPAIGEGSRILTAGLYEAAGRYDPFLVETTAQKSGEEYILSGEKALVPFGGEADALIVSARVSGRPGDRDGLALFLVEAQTDGLSRRPYPLVDGTRAAEVRLEGVRVGKDALLGEAGEAADVIERAIDEATAAVCAEAMGNMDRLHKLTLQYAQERKQFGAPISKFQVIQHKLVDMLIAKEEAISATYMATLKLDRSHGERIHAVSAAKAMIGKSAKFLGQTAIQVHGGMGMTWEMAAAHYVKRLTTIEQAFGDTEHHLKRFSRQSLASTA